MDGITKWPPLERRARVLYRYAKMCRHGNIVELGTHLGFGAFSLAYGTLAGFKCPVTTVDDYKSREGWVKEIYQPVDEVIFRSNRERLTYLNDINLKLLRMDARMAAKNIEGVSLLFVDLSPAIKKILDIWHDSMLVGGLVVFRDTIERSLGYDRIADRGIRSGKWIYRPEKDPFFIIVEKAETAWRDKDHSSG
jgi:predicted O-methyltransferase YrrM